MHWTGTKRPTAKWLLTEIEAIAQTEKLRVIAERRRKEADTKKREADRKNRQAERKQMHNSIFHEAPRKEWGKNPKKQAENLPALQEESMVWRTYLPRLSE